MDREAVGSLSSLVYLPIFCPFRPHETVTPLEDPVVREVNYVLREWNTTWKRLYVVS